MIGNVDLWFPTTIYTNQYNFSNNEKENLISKIENLSRMVPVGGNNWYSKIINSCGTYNLLEDSDFNNLNKWVEDSINEFAQTLSCKQKFTLTDGWFNIYHKGDFQEMHYHSKHTFSCAFYLKAPEGSSPICFENPLMPDMKKPEYSTQQQLNFSACEYPAKEGQLVAFRSYLRHIVPPHPLEETRISLAYNIL